MDQTQNNLPPAVPVILVSIILSEADFRTMREGGEIVSEGWRGGVQVRESKPTTRIYQTRHGIPTRWHSLVGWV